MNIKELVSKLTLEEKAGLCSGSDFWNTKAVERLGIPSLLVSDGPHGLRTQSGDAGDHLGIGSSIEATCFPTAAGVASSWNLDLIAKQAKAIATEAKAAKVAIVLGPGVNIKRSPLCGRNFEYFSEDPLLAGELAASYINSIQAEGVGVSMKHYAANNQETNRMGGNSVVDLRTLHELYLRPFEIAVKKASPTTLMCSYNKINGVFASHDEWLLTHVLRKLWGFEGYVMSDWGAVVDRVAGIKAGMELEMPHSGPANDQKIVEAVKSGEVDEALLDRACERILNITMRWVETTGAQEHAPADLAAQHKIAREIAGETMVLSKNENILPFDTSKTTAIIGLYAKEIKYQGGGSSHINNPYLDNVVEEFTKLSSGAVSYAEGYDANGMTTSELIAEAVDVAKTCENVLIVAGAPNETEGSDRKSMAMRPGIVALIEAVLDAAPNAAIVLTSGAPMELPFEPKAKAILLAYLGGQTAAGAIADLVTGAVSPSAKLAETWPVDHRQNPSHPNFGGRFDAVYGEGVFVGYKWYETHGITPRFPFGHGLTYTTFEYSNLTVDKAEMPETDTLTVTVDIKNTGNRAGKEIVQLYTADLETKLVPRPVKELAAFAKVSLEVGETKTVTLTLGSSAFAFWSVEQEQWVVESGAFKILVGPSSACTPLSADVTVHSTSIKLKPLTLDSTIGDMMEFPGGAQVVQQLMGGMAQGLGASADVLAGDEILGMDIKEMMGSVTLHAVIGFAGGRMPEGMIEGVIAQLNGAAGL